MTAIVLAALLAAPSPEPVELLYVDLQDAVHALPEGKKARERLDAAREKAQREIDARRAKLLAARAELSEAELEERTRALDAEIDAAEEALEALQSTLLAPIVAKLGGLAEAMERPGREVVRLDEAPLLGWPKTCEVTDRVVSRAAGSEAEELPRRPECDARVFRVVEVAPLAVASPAARDAERKVTAFRKQRQATIDEARARVERLEAKAKADPSEKKTAERARAELDRRVTELRGVLEARRVQAEHQVLSEIVEQIARAAAPLEGIAVVEKTSEPLPLPTEDGQAWAREVLGFPAPGRSSGE